MTKNQTTKRALLASVLSLLVCVSMLVGSTFAWFSDSVSTGVSKIQAGVLKIDLVYEDGSEVGDTIDFIKKDNSTTILWEPGCTYKLPNLYVKNMGNLAFKYKVIITGITGDAKLNEVIEWDIDYGYDDGKYEGYMLGTDTISKAIQISGHMKEEASNIYQGLSIDGITITVVATQYADEYDSFNNSYDVSADGTPDNPNYVNVNTTAEFIEALKTAGIGDVVVLNSGKFELDENIATNGSLEIKEGADVTLVLDDSKFATNVSKEINTPTVVNNGNLTIEGGVISNQNATAGNTHVAAVHNVKGNLTLKDCKIENIAPTSGGDYAVVVEGGKVVLENCTVIGARGGISVSGDGVVNMKGGSVSSTVYYSLYAMGNGNSVFENVKFIKNNSTKGKAITYNNLSTGGSVAFKECEFKSNLTNTTKLDINNNIVGFTFEDCTFDNVIDPNATE